MSTIRELIDDLHTELEAERERHQRLRSAAQQVWDAAQPFVDERYKVVYFAVRGEAMDGMVELLYADAERG